MWITAFSVVFVGSVAAMAALGYVLLLNATIFKRSAQREEILRQPAPTERRIVAAA